MIMVAQPPERSASSRVYKGILLVFLPLVAIIAVFALQVAFSRATVVILSDQQEIAEDVLVDIAVQADDSDVKGGMYEISKKLSQAFPTTSVMTVDMRSEGRVRISSDLPRAQTLVSSTRLLTQDDALFRIRDTVVVPARGEVEVDVFSEGTSGTADSDELIFTIPGLNPDTRRHFTVQLVGPMTGSKKDVRLVTAVDMLKAEETLRTQLEEELVVALRERAKEDGVATSGEIITFETARQDSDSKPGDEAEEFTVTVAVKGQAVFYDRAAFDARVRDLVGKRLSFGRKLIDAGYADGAPSVEKCDLVGGFATVRVPAKGTSVISAEAAGLDREKLVGVTVDAATEYLKTLDGVTSASIKMRPFWARRLPNMAEHIDVEVR